LYGEYAIPPKTVVDHGINVHSWILEPGDMMVIPDSIWYMTISACYCLSIVFNYDSLDSATAKGLLRLCERSWTNPSEFVFYREWQLLSCIKRSNKLMDILMEKSFGINMNDIKITTFTQHLNLSPRLPALEMKEQSPRLPSLERKEQSPQQQPIEINSPIENDEDDTEHEANRENETDEDRRHTHIVVAENITRSLQDIAVQDNAENDEMSQDSDGRTTTSDSDLDSDVNITSDDNITATDSSSSGLRDLLGDPRKDKMDKINEMPIIVDPGISTSIQAIQPLTEMPFLETGSQSQSDDDVTASDIGDDD